MHTLERTQKFKVIMIVFTFLFLALSVWGYMNGGYEIFKYGFMNEPLPSIVMIASFLASVILLLMSLTINALQKDITEELKILDYHIEIKEK